ncbi:MAG TPA: hypothetical protein PKC18_19975, partial [Lacipirellulaceae bacterium]|nr:hypothetical protein [Lacipirellulaceae bacterium]
VPPLLQHADEVRPGGAQEADRLDPGHLNPSPSVVEEAGQAVDRPVEGVDEEVLEVGLVCCSHGAVVLNFIH